MTHLTRADHLRQRIECTREAGERLDKLDYIKRYWLADYAGDVDVIGDALEAMLTDSGEPMCRGRRDPIWRLVDP